MSEISFFAKKNTFYHQNTLLDAFRTNFRNIIGRNPSMVIPLLANQDLTPMLLLSWFVVLVNSANFASYVSANVLLAMNFSTHTHAKTNMCTPPDAHRHICLFLMRKGFRIQACTTHVGISKSGARC